MTRTHVAILKKHYANLILSGQKTVESRITRTACAPYNNISPGDPIYIKISSGPFIAHTTALSIHFYDALSPYKLQSLQEKFNHAVCAPEEYWHEKQNCSFATFIQLGPITPTSIGPEYIKSMKAWHVIANGQSAISKSNGSNHQIAASSVQETPTSLTAPEKTTSSQSETIQESQSTLPPMFDSAEFDFAIALTTGSLKNNYIRIPNDHPILALTETHQNHLELNLPSFETIHTSIDHERKLIRWRGWANHFNYHHLQPGDMVRFVSFAPRRYRVLFIKNVNP
ncbi:hypothetical protein [Poriferisphaera sp. WC338]|uniref:hypothetical protein n=1 Tax=Poriferisphaera sp. WC338 TaxID=3425129 RepID=UPI003D81B5F4